jgi:hypothetical protein
MKVYLIIFICFLNYNVACGQVNITFIPCSSEKKLVKNQFFLLNDKDSVKVEKFVFYVSNIVISNKGGENEIDSNYYLIDVFDTTKNRININSAFKLNKKISFNLGLDSATNYGGVKGGALDPMNNMYWTWQSGYINIKLEGTSNLCPDKNKQYIFHLGGFQYPYNSLNRVTFPLKKDLVIYIDILEILKKINLKEISKVMSPSKKSVELSKLISKAFKIK